MIKIDAEDVTVTAWYDLETEGYVCQGCGKRLYIESRKDGHTVMDCLLVFKEQMESVIKEGRFTDVKVAR